MRNAYAPGSSAVPGPATGGQVQAFAAEDAEHVGLGERAVDVVQPPKLYSVIAVLVPG